MIPSLKKLELKNLEPFLKDELADEKNRLGMMSSIDGNQLFVLLLNTKNSSSKLIVTELNKNSYPSMSGLIPQLHWFERSIDDMFGITPSGHPRLRSNFVEQAFDPNLAPLREDGKNIRSQNEPVRDFRFMKVGGEGIYELPVGPVHAGVIEPGHFRLSCLGEYIQNLELRFGFLHRGVEKNIVNLPWSKARFAAEAVSSDSACANAFAHAIAMEDLLEIEASFEVQILRAAALEIERIAMHISDIGGMALDLGCSGVAATLSRLRGEALGLAELLSGSRFLRGYIFPGGVRKTDCNQLKKMLPKTKSLWQEVLYIIGWFLENAQVIERLTEIGRVSKRLALDFGLVGVAARASGVTYDVRESFPQAVFPLAKHKTFTQEAGDCLARTKLRAQELSNSFSILEDILENSGEIMQSSVSFSKELPQKLKPDTVGCGIVESFRGELIHLVFTDSEGQLKRYAVKDPSFNNWTGMAIAARGNLIADFPVCNKSFSLSYSGHDL